MRYDLRIMSQFCWENNQKKIQYSKSQEDVYLLIAVHQVCSFTGKFTDIKWNLCLAVIRNTNLSTLLISQEEITCRTFYGILCSSGNKYHIRHVCPKCPCRHVINIQKQRSAPDIYKSLDLRLKHPRHNFLNTKS